MAFLFKSKKNQDRALSSRDGNAPPPTAMSGANARMQRDEKHRATPTGSMHSIENDGVASPDRQVNSAHSRRGGSVDNNSNSALANPATDVVVSILVPCDHMAIPLTARFPSAASQRSSGFQPKRLIIPLVATPIDIHLRTSQPVSTIWRGCQFRLLQGGRHLFDGRLDQQLHGQG